jgi:hypothetical protein
MITRCSDQYRSLEGLKMLAQMVEHVLARVQLTVKDLTIRILHPDARPFGNVGNIGPESYSLAIKLPFLEIEDETIPDAERGMMDEQKERQFRQQPQHDDLEDEMVHMRTLKKVWNRMLYVEWGSIDFGVFWLHLE